MQDVRMISLAFQIWYLTIKSVSDIGPSWSSCFADCYRYEFIVVKYFCSSAVTNRL